MSYMISLINNRYCGKEAGLPEISPEEIQFLWCEYYYDGPLTGLCTVRGEEGYYFHCTDCTDRYHYTIFKLLPEQYRHVLGWFKKSVQYFGFSDTNLPAEFVEKHTFKVCDNDPDFYTSLREKYGTSIYIVDSQAVGWTTEAAIFV